MNHDRGIMPYLVEFMKFLCGFALMLGLSLTLLYFTSSETSANTSSETSSALSPVTLG